MGELLTEHHGGGVVEGDGSGGQSGASWFLVAAELRCLSGENLRCSRVFRWEPHVVKPGPRPGATWRLWAPPGLVLLAPGVFWRNRISVIFWEFSEHFGFWTFSAMHRHNKQKLALGTGLID